MEEAGVPLYPYGSKQRLNVKGKFPATLRVGDRMVDTEIYVTEEQSKYPLVSEDSAIALGLVQYNEEYIVKSVRDKESPTLEEIVREYPEVFLGTLESLQEEGSKSWSTKQ